MNYLLSLIIIFLIIGYFFRKNRKISLTGLILVLLALLTIFPKEALASAREGINLWLFIVLPSLFPFFIVNDILIYLEVPDSLSRFLAPITRVLFNTSGYGAYCFIMSIFSGYPAGAKIVNDLIDKGKIKASEGEKILSFSSTSGPLFIIGAVGAGMLNNVHAGYILFLCHIIGAIINGILFKYILRSKVSKHPVKLSLEALETVNSKNVLTYAIGNSLKTCGFIGGYIVLFSVIIAMLDRINFFVLIASLLKLFLPADIAKTLSLILKTGLEISNGCKITTTLDLGLEAKMLLLSFIIAFSGLSIIGQVQGVLYKTSINIKLYMASKLSHGLLSGVLCYAFLKLRSFSIETINYQNSSYLNIYIYSMLALLAIIMLFTTLGNLKKP